MRYFTGRAHYQRQKHGAFCTLLLVLLATPRVGATLQPDLNLSQLQHTAWTTGKGAPADIWALTQSSDGFLLLGTGSGIYRFDGVTFEHIVPTNAPDLAFRNVTALMALQSNDLWIGYYAGGVSRLSNGILTNYGRRDGVPGGWITSFAQETDGTLWVAALEGLGRFSNGHWQTVSSDWNFRGHSAHWLLLDHSGTLWVAGGDTVAFLRKGSHQFEDTGIRSGYASTLALAPDGAVWLAGQTIAPRPIMWRGTLMPGSAPASPLDPADRIIFDRDGSLWATDTPRGGIVRATERADNSVPGSLKSLNSPEAFNESAGLTSDKAIPLLEDREGNIWVGTNLGLNRFRATPFVRELRLPSSSHKGYSFAAALDGRVWIASDETLFESRGSGLQSVARLPARIRSMYRDPDGTLWLGTENGLYKMDAQGARSVPLPSSTPRAQYEYVHAISSDGAGGLWVSVVNRGLLRLRDGIWETTASSELGDAAPTALWTDDSHRQWLGYSDGTLVVREHSGTRTFGPTEGLRVGPVTLIRGTGEEIYVGGERGLARLEAGRFHTLSAARSDVFSGISGMIVGIKGEVWLNGNRGVVYMTSEALKNAYEHPDGKLEYEIYDVQDGLPGYAQQNEDSTAIAGADGRLWFATNHGVAWIDPAHRPHNQLPPRVVIRDIEADGHTYPASDSIDLPKSVRSLRIDYTALSLVAPERILFRYKLEGADDGWRAATNERSVRYANLHAGHYTFRVTATNNDGVWSEADASVRFSLPPAFYQRTWFVVAGALICGGILWLLYYCRLRYVTERQRKRIEQRMEDRFSERARIARELHDTLLQSLQGLLLRYQVAQELLPEHPDEAKEDLGRAIEQTVHAINEGRNAVQGLRTSRIDHHDLADSIKTLMEELGPSSAREKVIFRVGLQGTPQPLRTAVREEIYEIAAEALRNSRHHSQASEVEVDLLYDQSEFRLRVRDNGVGIDPQFLDGQGLAGHYGLNGMRERAELVAGKLVIWTAVSAGTEIEFTVPAAQAYLAKRPQRFPWLTRILARRTEEEVHE